ncbi:hypothetical protein IWQ61_001171 [Dispira simplex]|nr:hypothetical protein IWQ61_001171 [Dispira simplex]
MAAQLYKTESGRLFHAGAIALITVGLPARGKTHISRALCRFLRWLGVPTKVFHVGEYRRKLIHRSVSHDFFDPANKETAPQRLEAANQALEDMIAYLLQGGQVGIYDGSNLTADRRQYIQDRLEGDNIQTVFIESLCTDERIVDENIRTVKITSTDYQGWEVEKAVQDFKVRVKTATPYYQTIEDESQSYIKLINVDQQIITNRIQGFLPSRLVFYLMNLHTAPRAIYFARNAMSTDEKNYKADPSLTQEGQAHAKRLYDILIARRRARAAQGYPASAKPLKIWTSIRQSTHATAVYFPHEQIRQRKSLAALHPGVYDGLSPDEIKSQYPEEYAARQKDPYRHRYPRGESYHDLSIRLESVILELEHEKQDVLIIAHESVLQCLYAYFCGYQPAEAIPSIQMPRNILLEIRPSAYGSKEERIEILPNDTTAS